VNLKARKLVPTRVMVASKRKKRWIGVPHDGSEVPGFAEWMAGQEGSTKHAQRMAAGEGRALLQEILATAPELKALYSLGLEILKKYDRYEERNELPPKYTKAYKDQEHLVRRTETFCAGVVNALTMGITEPWALMLYACERVREFDRHRRRKSRLGERAIGQQRIILQHVHQIIAASLANDYKSLRRTLGQKLKGTGQDSNITKVLEHHRGELAKYGKRFAPKLR
jgi:hypothetical protein